MQRPGSSSVYRRNAAGRTFRWLRKIKVCNRRPYHSFPNHTELFVLQFPTSIGLTKPPCYSTLRRFAAAKDGVGIYITFSLFILNPFGVLATNAARHGESHTSEIS